MKRNSYSEVMEQRNRWFCRVLFLKYIGYESIFIKYYMYASVSGESRRGKAKYWWDMYSINWTLLTCPTQFYASDIMVFIIIIRSSVYVEGIQQLHSLHLMVKRFHISVQNGQTSWLLKRLILQSNLCYRPLVNKDHPWIKTIVCLIRILI